MPTKRFPKEVVAKIDAGKSLGVRSGATHKHTNVWVVVVDGRVMVRSWNDTPTGWFRAFKKQPVGAIVIKGKAVPARGLHVKNAAMLKAVSDALEAKYPYKGAQHYIDGFRETKRLRTTMEFVPA